MNTIQSRCQIKFGETDEAIAAIFEAYKITGLGRLDNNTINEVTEELEKGDDFQKLIKAVTQIRVADLNMWLSYVTVEENDRFQRAALGMRGKKIS